MLAPRAVARASEIAGTALVLALALVLVLAPVAQAVIPGADRTIREIARVNAGSGRNQAIQLELTMRVGDRPPVARGQLISHPSGLARLELRGFNGRVDRYLLSGRELMGAKDGLRLDRPQPLLQPLFFLQPSTSSTLRTALESFDVLSDVIGLAPCGDQDCFVIGDPRLAAPLPEPEPLYAALNAALDGDLDDERDVLRDPLGLEGAAYGLATDAERGLLGPDGAPLAAAESSLDGPLLTPPEDALLPRLWVDTEDLQVRRIDRASGVFTVFGPIGAFERLQVPAWFEIHEPGAEPIRFEVDRAVQVNAPPQAFSRQWLLAPVDEPSDGAPPPASERPLPEAASPPR